MLEFDLTRLWLALPAGVLFLTVNVLIMVKAQDQNKFFYTVISYVGLLVFLWLTIIGQALRDTFGGSVG